MKDALCQGAELVHGAEWASGRGAVDARVAPEANRIADAVVELMDDFCQHARLSSGAIRVLISAAERDGALDMTDGRVQRAIATLEEVSESTIYLSSL